MSTLDTEPTVKRWFSSVAGLLAPWVLYGAWHLGYDGAANLLTFLAVVYPVVILLVGIARGINEIGVDIDGHLAALPKWTDKAHKWSDFAIIAVFAWHGWFVTAGLWFIGAFFEMGLKSNARDEVEKRENGTADGDDVKEWLDREFDDITEHGGVK